MDLYSVTVCGFRRFRTREKLQTNGKLVALLGPNEAGKSSLLHAISLLAHDDPPAPGDIARNEPEENFVVEGRYFLSVEDIAAANIPNSRWLTVVKRKDGLRRYKIEPTPPQRDTRPRQALASAVQATVSHGKFASRAEENGLFEGLDESISILKSTKEDLKPEEISSVEAYVNRVAEHIIDADPAATRKLPAILENFKNSEAANNPGLNARIVLKARLPKILFFDEEARALSPEYDIESLTSGTPSALSNVCRIAELDISALISAHKAGDVAKVTTLEHRANESLKARFTKDWKQSGVSVSLRIQDGQLAVQVVNESYEFTSFAERSDGLRQFVALQAFATGLENGSSILLLDEADQKLHYDAQADLVQMLARQKLASKVIYTTHSAGCLPEDLGNGVRFARPKPGDLTRSEVSNKFWAENETGYAPLLIGMGASTLAFFPTRHAVMVEGPVDMLILPTMFREALSIDVLGFQFVPGLSCAEDETSVHAPAVGKELGILYLVDSDQGGVKLHDRLTSKNVPKKDIFLFKSKNDEAKELEDFIDPSLLVDATNGIIEKHFSDKPRVSESELVKKDRMGNLERLFRLKTGTKLAKVDLAYEILDILADDPSRRSLDQSRKSAFKAVASSIIKRFEALAKKSG